MTTSNQLTNKKILIGRLYIHLIRKYLVVPAKVDNDRQTVELHVMGDYPIWVIRQDTFHNLYSLYEQKDEEDDK